jgi:hypothetical protein
VRPPRPPFRRRQRPGTSPSSGPETRCRHRSIPGSANISTAVSREARLARNGADSLCGSDPAKSPFGVQETRREGQGCGQRKPGPYHANASTAEMWATVVCRDRLRIGPFTTPAPDEPVTVQYRLPSLHRGRACFGPLSTGHTSTPSWPTFAPSMRSYRYGPGYHVPSRDSPPYESRPQ